MFHAPFAMAFVFLGTGVALSQQTSPNDPIPKCNFSEVFKKDGWTVPGISGAKVKQRAKLSNMPGVFVTTFEPANAEANLTNVICVREHTGRLEVKDGAPIKILMLWSFDLGGRVFAYRVEFASEVIYDGKRQECACESYLFFYDMEGSGKFVLMDSGKGVDGHSIGYLPSFIPDWVKSQADAPPTR